MSEMRTGFVAYSKLTNHKTAFNPLNYGGYQFASVAYDYLFVFKTEEEAKMALSRRGLSHDLFDILPYEGE